MYPIRERLLALSIAALAIPVSAETIAVTTSADSGPGSLRQAILDANSGACVQPCRITYGSLPMTSIDLLTPLPTIGQPLSITADPPYQAWTLEIGGRRLGSGSGLDIRAANVTVNGLIINGFPGSGIVVEDGSRIEIAYCVIGADPTGTRVVPNGQNGITVFGGNSISIDSCTIGGNGGHGIYVAGAASLELGLDTIGKQGLPQGSGNAPLPNGGAGVFLQDVQSAMFVGDIITNNALGGVIVAGSSRGIAIEDAVLATLIYGNGGLPIDIGNDGITDAGRPRLRTADISNGYLRVIGDVDASPNGDVLVNVFASDNAGSSGIADAQISLYAAKIKAGANGIASFEFRFAPKSDVTGKWISTTSTTTSGSSELSSPMKAVANNQNYEVTTTADSGPGSLRQAIIDANSGICAADFPCRVEFNLPDGQSTISPLTPLPPITRSGIMVDGENVPLPAWGRPQTARRIEINGSRCAPGAGLTISSATGAVDGILIARLAISGFDGDGILIDATANPIDNPVIISSFIGVDRSGTAAVPNSGAGIHVKGNVPFIHVGTYASGNRLVTNVISGNTKEGVLLEGGFFELDSNFIGTDLSGKLPIPNGESGVQVEPGARAHLEGNILSFNRQAGIVIGTTTPDAFKALIGNSVHSNAGPAIVQQQAVSDSPRQTPPQIKSVTYDPATKTGVIEGSVVRPPMPVGWWNPVLEFAASTYPERGGRGSGETVIYSNPPTYSALPDGSLAFQVKTNSDLQGKRISGTATPFNFQGFKGAPAGNIFGQGFVYGTTSEMSRAVPVVTAGCAVDSPRVDTTPRQIAAGSFELQWSTAAGASSYNVWLREVPGIPRLIGNTAGATMTTLLERGGYEWFVEALFPGCPSVMSEVAPLEVTQGRQRAVRH